MDEETYLKERVMDQIDWYDKKSIRYKKIHDAISIGCIMSSSSTSLFTVLSLIIPSCSAGFIITAAVLAFMTTVALAFDKQKNFEELHHQYRRQCEHLKQEKYLFMTGSDVYNDPSKKINFNLFVQRTESMLSTEVGNWAQLNEKKQSH